VKKSKPLELRPRERQAIALSADVDVKTLEKFLRGEGHMFESTKARIVAALKARAVRT
jgi:hypothetical protein